jgi:hypothetical protein
MIYEFGISFSLFLIFYSIKYNSMKHLFKKIINTIMLKLFSLCMVLFESLMESEL